MNKFELFDYVKAAKPDYKWSLEGDNIISSTKDGMFHISISDDGSDVVLYLVNNFNDNEFKMVSTFKYKSYDKCETQEDFKDVRRSNINLISSSIDHLIIEIDRMINEKSISENTKTIQFEEGCDVSEFLKKLKNDGITKLYIPGMVSIDFAPFVTPPSQYKSMGVAYSLIGTFDDTLQVILDQSVEFSSKTLRYE